MSTILKVEKNAEKAVKQVRKFCMGLVIYTLRHKSEDCPCWGWSKAKKQGELE
jgi:hypothetical protein